MIIVTTESFPGKTYQALGLVKGNMVQSKNIGKDIGAGFKGIAGGELKSYTAMMEEAREMATQRMIKEAEALGADGIVAVRYVTSGIVQGAAEMVAYGTAVKFK